MVFWLEPNGYPRGNLSKLTSTVSNQNVGREINRMRNGAFKKGSPFCNRGVKFSFGFTASVVLGAHRGAHGRTVHEMSASDIILCEPKPPVPESREGSRVVVSAGKSPEGGSSW